ncbi:hypothetical protein KSF_087230 [Reticulibacter mediterranei]|uniref:Uncharacterized protein n=2 Tax=Reticulibacter mediterranei TaxID=2778369 RepID=A0A8J3IUC0_9CHLR|nr:hypothetical protein KSF_087230 [Reticulibacter mediterranei]
MLEIVRLLAETTDNFLLLQAGVQTIQQQVLPLLEELHKGQLSCLEHWQLELDIYRGQMSDPMRPTMRWEQASREEEALSRRKEGVERWYHNEQERVQQHLQHLQEAMQAHESHLEECAQRFVQQGLRPGCIAGIAAVLTEHRERLQGRRERLSHEHEARGQQLTALQARYQDEMQALQASRQGTEAQFALKRKGITTGWVVQNLFGIGTPQSLTLTQRVMQQMEASHQFHWYIRCATHYFWYVEQVWALHSELAAKVHVLSARWTHWNRLLGVLDESSDPTVVLLALSGQ